ncbi:YdcP family protein [Carnobacterium gallinarum]|uniref:YdcP family protein n=1 Tax=Carnobacterium gallinarum TaxID=2749 RepID=UPI000554DF84|nr:YdcP family protein [Carnobacterium gallinarum]
MELNYVVPNAEKTFGNLEYGGSGEVKTKRINGVPKVMSRAYKLFSSVQKADEILVVLPPEATEKNFDFMESVQLVNPRITAEGYKIGERGFTNYICLADDIIKL